MTNFEDFKGLLESPKNMIITAHIRPDADALGSSLALKNYLIKKNHTVTVIMPTIYPEFLFWMKGHSEVLIFENQREECLPLINKADVIFCLDFNALSRIGEMGEEVEKSSAKKVLIDHHLQPEDFADFVLSDTSAAATAELIYRLINQLGETDLIDGDIGECIYAGMMTDTGSFRFPSTNKNVHLIVADLMDKGINHTKVHRLIYDNNTETRLRFLGHCLTSCLVIIPESNTAYISLSEKDIAPFDVQTGDTEGIVNYALSMKNIVFAALFKEDKGFVKMSFRSKGEFSVNDFSRSHFNGGGHRNAAGGRVENALKEVTDKFKSLLPEYTKSLNDCYSKLEK